MTAEIVKLFQDDLPKRFKLDILNKAHSYNVVNRFMDYRIRFKGNFGFWKNEIEIRYDDFKAETRTVDGKEDVYSWPSESFTHDVNWLDRNFQNIKPSKKTSLWRFLFKEKTNVTKFDINQEKNV